MGLIPYLLIAIVMLGILILVHEMGHYLVGRALHFDIEEFAIGMGPRLFGWERKGIKYSLRAIPLGGFVAFAGDEDESNPRAMNNKPWYKRAAVFVSGIGANLLFSVLLTAILVGCVGYYGAQIKSVAPESNIAQTSLQEGDIVYALNGQRMVNVSELSERLAAVEPGEELTLTVLRDGKKVKISSTKYLDAETNTYLLGIRYGYEVIHPGVFGSVGYSLEYNWWMTKAIYKTLGQLVTGQLSVETLTGPVSTVGTIGGILQDTANNDVIPAGERAREVVILIIELLVVISTNLAVMNLLPIPALDGFRLLFVIIEGITGKRIPKKAEGIINTVGLLVLIGLMVVLEVSKLFVS